MQKKTQTFKQVREQIDAELQQYVAELVHQLSTQTDVAYVRAGTRYLEKLVLAGGKRVRGYVLAEMYHTAGGNDDAMVMKAASAMELFHLFALIHDDIMDHAASRRGVTTMHHFTEEWLREHERVGDLVHVGVSQAILWGDFLLALSQSRLQQLAAPAVNRDAMLMVFMRMFTEVVVGQMIDVDMTTRTSVTQQEVAEKTLLKTALYTFVRPMQMGAALASAPPEMMRFCDTYGRALGVAFQLQDDLFDVVSREADLQKPVLNDVQSGEHTVLSTYIFEHGTAEQQRMFRRCFGTLLSTAELATVRQLFYDSGAVSYAEAVIAQEFQAAEAALELLNPDERGPWRDLIELIRGRKS